jgi:hypothetical protein
MLGAVFRLGVLVSIASSCQRPSDFGPVPEFRPLQPTCHAEAQRVQVCQEMGEARLVFGHRTVPLTLKECSANSYGAIVHWHGVDREPFDYHGVVRFDWSAPRERLTPVEVAPLQLAWPVAAQDLNETTRVLVPVGKPCATPPSERTWLELALPGPNERACVSGPWLRGNSKPWCTRKLTAGSELYAVHDFGWLRGRQSWMVAVAPTEVLISHGHARKVITDPSLVTRLVKQLNDLWALDLSVEEHCRDGGETVVEALRPTGWRTITRNCSDPAGVIRLLKALGPAQPPAPPSSQQ